MTDEELIEQLRSEPTWGGLVALTKQAADRIEALIAMRDTMSELWAKEASEKNVLAGQCEALEAKLAKAEWLLTDAAVQLEEGKIKTRCNRAGLIWQFLEEIKAT